MRVLCSGDLHVGRRPTRLPRNVDAHLHSAAAAWRAIVDYALTQQVDVVALSGDVVDQANRYYESLGPLEQGLRRLGAAGIPTVAVAGNHDYEVLPELARVLPADHFRLLGLGGRWERATLERPGGTLHVDGWSFPTQHVRESPLAAYDLPDAAGVPVLGLVHGDLDAPTSVYAPLSLADLHARPVSMWLLGHVHAPALRKVAGKPVVLYPGSPQPMDPGETGLHGAWLVDLAPGRPTVVRQIPLATVRYGLCEIDIGAATDLPAARAIIVERVRDAATAMVEGTGIRHVSLRLRLTGRSALHRELDREATLLAADLAPEIPGAAVHVERVEVAARPARDLDALAAGTDGIAIVAQVLRHLERGEREALPEELRRAIGAIPATLGAARPYRSLAVPDTERPTETLDAALARQAGLLLDELLAQKGAAA